jgi:hypothetical protein
VPHQGPIFRVVQRIHLVHAATQHTRFYAPQRSDQSAAIVDTQLYFYLLMYVLAIGAVRRLDRFIFPRDFHSHLLLCPALGARGERTRKAASIMPALDDSHD